MSLVSVPCEACRKPIGFEHTTCPSCGALVPAHLKKTLEVRLEASDIDYKASKDGVRRAAAVVLVLGAVYIAWGVVAFIANHIGETIGPGAADDVAIDLLVINGSVGAAMIGCFFWAKRAPFVALVAALLLFVSVHALAAIVFPLSLLTGLVVKCLGVLLLLSGIVSAWQASALLKRYRSKSVSVPDNA